MSIHHSLLTSSTLQILQIRMIIHKEILCQHSRTPGLTKNIEPFLPVHISIWHISPDTTNRKVLDSRLTKTSSQFTRFGMPWTGTSLQSVALSHLVPFPAAFTWILTTHFLKSTVTKRGKNALFFVRVWLRMTACTTFGQNSILHYNTPKKLSMKRADFMDMSNISWHQSIKRGHFMDWQWKSPGIFCWAKCCQNVVKFRFWTKVEKFGIIYIYTSCHSERMKWVEESF